MKSLVIFSVFSKPVSHWGEIRDCLLRKGEFTFFIILFVGGIDYYTVEYIHLQI